MIYLLLPVLLTLLMSIFTATETAAISVEKSRLGRESNAGFQWAKRTLKFLDHPDRFFSTILVCEDFMLVLSSTLFAHYCITRWGSASVVVATIVMTLVSFIISQYAPKMIALSAPVAVLKWFSAPVSIAGSLMLPAVIFYSLIANRIARFFPRREKADSTRRSDIVHALGEYEKESSLIASRLFYFSKRTMAEVMIPMKSVHRCAPGKELDSLRWKVTRVPVMDETNDRPIGIFNVKDYFFTGRCRLRKPLFVKTDDRCMPVFILMKKTVEHMAIVLDHGQRPVGIITMEDLIEELVGEIREEK